MLKRCLAIFVIAAFLTAFSGCASGNSQTSSTLTDSSSSRQSTVSPLPTEKKPEESMLFRFVTMADSRGVAGGPNLDIVNQTLQQIKLLSPQPQFAVMPGDLIEGGPIYNLARTGLEDFRDAITKYYPITFFYPGIGNHEVQCGPDGEKAFGEIFPEFKANFLDGYNRTAYYFDYSGCRFFMLNSNHPGESDTIAQKQMDWLKSNISPSSKYNFYFVHEPAYPTGAHIGSSLDAHKAARDDFWELVDGSNSPMVFCGHEHFYSRRHINSDFNEKIDNRDYAFKKNIYQVTVGTFGAPFYTETLDKKDVDVTPIPNYHFAVVDVYKDKIHVRVSDIYGSTIDEFDQTQW